VGDGGPVLGTIESQITDLYFFCLEKFGGLWINLRFFFEFESLEFICHLLFGIWDLIFSKIQLLPFRPAQ